MNGAGSAFEHVLEGYRRRLAEEAQMMRSPGLHAHRDELLLPVGEEVAELCVNLVVARRARIIVELGSSYGFSTLYLAEAARRTGGRLYSYEIVPAKQQYAHSQLAEAGLAQFVEWRLGDAVSLLGSQPGPIEFVLLDLWKDLYVSCLDAFYPNLAENGVIVADNMLYPEQARRDAAVYREAVRRKPGIEAVLLPIGQGIDLACRSLRPQDAHP